MKKYYFAGAQRVAMRQGSNSPQWIFSDHLGSTSKIASTTGTVAFTTLYKAWGETRYTSGTAPTTYKYTGQREESSFGLYYYGARWYDTALGRFVQADTIVPDGVQGLDRYAYVNNNPLRYTDPSGHDVGCGGKECGENNEESEGNNLNSINNTETTDNPPHPDAPPDFGHSIPDGNTPPPHVDGLPDDQ
jgi:RHS repeat-associated protein